MVIPSSVMQCASRPRVLNHFGRAPRGAFSMQLRHSGDNSSDLCRFVALQNIRRLTPEYDSDRCSGAKRPKVTTRGKVQL